MAKKLSRIRRTFTPQFKKDAVALVLAGRSHGGARHPKKALAYFADDQK